MSVHTDNFTIGVLGGMGTYATIHLFQEYAELFPAEKEWDRPRILIDNNCTMPSRVRAILYNEGKEELVAQMTDSIGNLIRAGADRILLACNTSHLFLPQVYERLPEAREKVLDIIDACVEALAADRPSKTRPAGTDAETASGSSEAIAGDAVRRGAGAHTVYLLATEGTLLSRVYQDRLAAAGIDCVAPEEAQFPLIRDCIEAVKQNRYTDEILSTFEVLLAQAGGVPVILGCTELPVLYAHMQHLCRAGADAGVTRGRKRESEAGKSGAGARECVVTPSVYDPLHIALQRLREEYVSK